MNAAGVAVLLDLQAIGRVPLVLRRNVVAVVARLTSQRYDFAISWLCHFLPAFDC
jgi:hypothetical protein